MDEFLVVVFMSSSYLFSLIAVLGCPPPFLYRRMDASEIES